MTSRDFCYWLQGAMELGQVKSLSEEQTTVLRNHLNMVFVHEIDPSLGDEAHKEEVRRAHEGPEASTATPAGRPGLVRPGLPGGGSFDPHTTRIMC